MKDAEQVALRKIEKLEIKFHIFKMFLMVLLAGIIVTVLYAQSHRAINEAAKQQQQTRAYITCILAIRPTNPNPYGALANCTKKYGSN